MAAPTYPDRPEWLSHDEWQVELARVRQRHRIDGATMPIGLISAEDAGVACDISPEEVWWEAWELAVIRAGHKVKPPLRPDPVAVPPTEQSADNDLPAAQQVVVEAVQSIWGSFSKIPAMTPKVRNKQILDWMAAHKRGGVSSRTIARVFAKLDKG